MFNHHKIITFYNLISFNCLLWMSKYYNYYNYEISYYFFLVLRNSLDPDSGVFRIRIEIFGWIRIRVQWIRIRNTRGNPSICILSIERHLHQPGWAMAWWEPVLWRWIVVGGIYPGPPAGDQLREGKLKHAAQVYTHTQKLPNQPCSAAGII